MVESYITAIPVKIFAPSTVAGESGKGRWPEWYAALGNGLP